MINGKAIINSFRQIGFAGIPYATKIVAEEQSSVIAYLAESGKLSELFLGVRGPEDLKRIATMVRSKLTEQTVKNARCSIDAASLVFAHSILDDALGSFLQITSDVAPAYWEKRLEGKQVPLAKLRDSIEKVVASFVAKEVRETRRNASLIEKCDLLHAVSKPKATQLYTEYKFDQGKLSEIDKLRQDLIHGDLLGQEIADAETALDYLHKTGIYFFVMLNQSFGLRIDTTVFSKQGGSAIRAR
jgi:hypothetical protein